MKFFVYITLIAAIFSVVLAGPVSSGSSASADKEAAAEQNAQGVHLQNMFDLSRFRKSAYGGGASSIPAPLCPQNYLISCQPNLAPVACAPPPRGY
ncbi:vitelline membrane protein Vm26Aa-like [Anastrepha ludens]|uniref:vitelline membrane protein Vm26Aa-like n=1 Tax=Anastrepha ludens TaxID=28586 RepID=UPI0023B1A70E|nr:vitelline membrane protein Vm26Aa-like [Anastrepha ludens]